MPDRIDQSVPKLDRNTISVADERRTQTDTRLIWVKFGTGSGVNYKDQGRISNGETNILRTGGS